MPPGQELGPMLAAGSSDFEYLHLPPNVLWSVGEAAAAHHHHLQTCPAARFVGSTWADHVTTRIHSSRLILDTSKPNQHHKVAAVQKLMPHLHQLVIVLPEGTATELATINHEPAAPRQPASRHANGCLVITCITGGPSSNYVPDLQPWATAPIDWLVSHLGTLPPSLRDLTLQASPWVGTQTRRAKSLGADTLSALSGLVAAAPRGLRSLSVHGFRQPPGALYLPQPSAGLGPGNVHGLELRALRKLAMPRFMLDDSTAGAAAQQLSGLTSLDIGTSVHRLTRAGLTALLSMPHLRWLRLRGLLASRAASLAECVSEAAERLAAGGMVPKSAPLELHLELVNPVCSREMASVLLVAAQQQVVRLVGLRATLASTTTDQPNELPALLSGLTTLTSLQLTLGWRLQWPNQPGAAAPPAGAGGGLAAAGEQLAFAAAVPALVAAAEAGTVPQHMRQRLAAYSTALSAGLGGSLHGLRFLGLEATHGSPFHMGQALCEQLAAASNLRTLRLDLPAVTNQALDCSTLVGLEQLTQLRCRARPWGAAGWPSALVLHCRRYPLLEDLQLSGFVRVEDLAALGSCVADGMAAAAVGIVGVLPVPAAEGVALPSTLVCPAVPGSGVRGACSGLVRLVLWKVQGLLPDEAARQASCFGNLQKLLYVTEAAPSVGVAANVEVSVPRLAAGPLVLDGIAAAAATLARLDALRYLALVLDENHDAELAWAWCAACCKALGVLTQVKYLEVGTPHPGHVDHVAAALHTKLPQLSSLALVRVVDERLVDC